MEQPRPRLLRTYSGLRGRRGGGGGGGRRRRPAPTAGLRRLPALAPWISPQVDPKRLFSTSSSSAASSSSFSFDDPDFLPSKGRLGKKPPQSVRLKKKKGTKKGAKKKQAQKEGAEEDRARKEGAEEDRAQKEGAKEDQAWKEGAEEDQAWKEGAEEDRAPQKRAKGNRGPHNKENWASNNAFEVDGGASDFVPPTQLRRHVTHRQHARAPPLPPKAWSGLRRRPPLLCSTPELSCLTPEAVKRDWIEGEEERVFQDTSPVSCLCDYRHSCRLDVLREDSCAACNDLLSELSLLKMDRDAEEMGGSLELFGQEGSGSRRRRSSCEDFQMLRLSRSPCTPFQSHSAGQLRNIWNKREASSGNREELATLPGSSASSPNKNDVQMLPGSPKTNSAPLSPSRGAFQLQARLCDDKIALSLPKEVAHLATKREQISAQVAATPQKTAPELNGVFSDEVIDLDQSSPQFQPVVLLDNQVVPNWLASQSSRKQTLGRFSEKKKDTLPLDALPGISGSTSQVVPICGAGTTGRKACISGFSSSRWRQRGKPERARHKKNVRWKPRADSSFLQESMEDNLALSFLSPDCTLKNSSLWRRIRASFSLHKKKKILSRTESLNSSIVSTSPRTRLKETLNTPFTQKLGYSICPSSSMVLLSSMTSFSPLEVTLTDAEKVYGECQQRGPIPFEECIPPDQMEKCEKIGEGVFGEVFRTEGERGAVALKIIPIEGEDRVNGEPQKTFSEILPEIIISKELSLLAEEEVNRTAGFVRLHSVHCVQGTYPEPLLSTWDEYHWLRGSENNRPDFFGDEQLFMVLEFEFGGTDLENMRNRQLNSLAVAKSILQQVTASLAVAEEALHFEHRDLHWGNVLVKKTDVKDMRVTLNGETRVLPTQGFLVNIIDYTFSRLERDGLTVYCDLSTDEEVFQGRGDYQFDIYRQMKEENANSWAGYYPHSNILWLHYLADKLLKEVSYKKKATSSSLRQIQRQLKLFSEEVLGFQSATDLLNASTFFQ